MLFSILIPCLNEGDEAARTVESIRSTSPAEDVEIVLVDDGSDVPVVLPADVKLIRHPKRIGCQKSREEAARAASGKIFVITDAHVRFVPGWYEEARRLSYDNDTCYCSCCRGLDKKNHPDLASSIGRYRGGHFIFWDAARNFLLTSEWSKNNPPDMAELASFLGAGYFIPRSTWAKIGGMGNYRMYGSDMEILSTKTWMVGGRILYADKIEVGHFFRSNAPYATECWNMPYNRLRLLHELLTQPQVDFILNLLPKNVLMDVAMRQIREDMPSIVAAREDLKSKTVLPFTEYCKKFSIAIPEGFPYG